MRHCKKHSRGFTLIEVLVAFMILTLSLTVLFRIFSGGLTSIATAGDYTRAVQIARSQLAATGISADLNTGITRGDEDDRFRWQQTVNSYDPGTNSGDLQGPLTAYSVTVDVFWSHDGDERQISLRSIRLRPAAGGAG